MLLLGESVDNEGDAIQELSDAVGGTCISPLGLGSCKDDEDIVVKMRGDAFEGTRVPALGSRGRDDDKGGTLWMRDGAFSWSRASTLGLEGCDNDLGGAVQMRGDAVDASHDLSLVWWIHGREKGVAVRVLGAAFSGARVRHPGRGEATTKRMLRYQSWLLHAPGHVSHHLVRGDGMSMLAGLERSGAMLSTGPVFRQSELSDHAQKLRCLFGDAEGEFPGLVNVTSQEKKTKNCFCGSKLHTPATQNPQQRSFEQF